MGEKDLLLFVCSCVMAGQTQKNARFFLRCPDWFTCFYRICTILTEEICEMLQIYK